jgi:hypothetical protein
MVLMEIRRGLRFNHTRYLPLSKARHQPGSTTAIHHVIDKPLFFFSLPFVQHCHHSSQHHSISDQELAFSLLCPRLFKEWKKGPMCRLLNQNTTPVWFLSLNQGNHVFLIFFKPPDFTSLTTVLANHAIYILF